MKVQRVEKHVIKPNHRYYRMLDNFCFFSKNLYNHANYIVRNEFIKNHVIPSYGDLDKILKSDKDYPDYKKMPTAQSAQQLLRQLIHDWTSFFHAIQDWANHKEKYLGRPKLPKYKKKEGRTLLILTNQNAKLKGTVITFPKSFQGFTLKTTCSEKENFLGFHQIRILPRNNFITIEVVYSIEIEELQPKNGTYCSIDLGIDNLAAVVNNIGKKSYVINGRGLKSINQYYNKQIRHYKEISKRMNDKDTTKRMKNITAKRNRKIADGLHKASRYLVNDCIEKGIPTIIIGYNENWKQACHMGKRTNQNFVGIPIKKFIEMIEYKAREVGIEVVLQEESYTSGTSFLDGEKPNKQNYKKSRRIHRGLFISNEGKKINADVNAAYQIMKKAVPKVSFDSNGIEGAVLHPIRVNAAYF